ncbi:CD209 antigen-like protein C [Engraulis encrasicolus]|uniref:CD209 antigen-like protein C n=1 Tax=Engraulis encrasicolus TaxID=184585 RepID=UPI002FD58C85
MADQINGNVDHIQRFDFDEDDVYANEETTASERRDEMENKEEESTGGDFREVKCYRVSVVSLVLLCLLLLAIIISVAIKGTLQQFMNNNLTQEKDQLKTAITILTQEKEQLQTENNNLTQEKDQLQATISHLNKLWGWKSFGSSLYYIYSDKKSWADSKQHCMDLGAHLVIIDSQEEQEFILERIKTRAWIGLSDLETEGVWKWVDGNNLGKPRFWMQGEPNDQDGGEDCVEIIASQKPLASWKDHVCGITKNYICEI